MSDFTPQPPVKTTKTSIMAIISLVTGILGFIQVLPAIGPLAAVITGHIAKNEIKKSNGMVTGNGLATTGLILGYIMVAIGLCVTCILILTFAGLITLPFALPWDSYTYSY